MQSDEQGGGGKGRSRTEEVRNWEERPGSVRDFVRTYCGRTDFEELERVVEGDNPRWIATFDGVPSPQLNAAEVKYLFGGVMLEIASHPRIKVVDDAIVTRWDLVVSVNDHTK